MVPLTYTLYITLSTSGFFVVDELTIVNDTIQAVSLDGVRNGSVIQIGDTIGEITINSVTVVCKSGENTNAYYQYNESKINPSRYFDTTCWLASCAYNLRREATPVTSFLVRTYEADTCMIYSRRMKSSMNEMMFDSLPVVPVVSVLSDSETQYDEENNEWIAKKDVTNSKYIQVTFDANGGTIQENGNSNQMTKDVITGEQYGELPIPVREGYEFLGWNGKNLYDVNNMPNARGTRYSMGVNLIEDDWISINTISGQRWYNYWTHNLNVNEGMPYTIVVEIKEATNISGDLFVTSLHQSAAGTTICQFPNEGIESNKLVSNSVIIKDITSNRNVQEDFGLRTFYDNKNNNGNEKLVFRISVLSNQNISEGNFKYEPHYIQSTTEVVQNSNHTLTAMWARKN